MLNLLYFVIVMFAKIFLVLRGKKQWGWVGRVTGDQLGLGVHWCFANSI